jgi:hypothetical protein
MEIRIAFTVDLSALSRYPGEEEELLFPGKHLSDLSSSILDNTGSEQTGRVVIIDPVRMSFQSGKFSPNTFWRSFIGFHDFTDPEIRAQKLLSDKFHVIIKTSALNLELTLPHHTLRISDDAGDIDYGHEKLASHNN